MMRKLLFGAVFMMMSHLAGCAGTAGLSGKYGGAYIETIVREVKADLSEIEAVTITAPNGQVLFQRRAGTMPREGRVWSGGLGADVLEYVRVTWRKDSGWVDVPLGDSRRNDQYYRRDVPAADRGRLIWAEGFIASEHTVPVASQIPSELGHALRKHPDDTLTIKLKVFPNKKSHPTGVSLGWETQRIINGTRKTVLMGGDSE